MTHCRLVLLFLVPMFFSDAFAAGSQELELFIKYFGPASSGLIVLLSFLQIVAGLRTKTLDDGPNKDAKAASVIETEKKEALEETTSAKVPWSKRLGSGLAKSRQEIWGKLSSLASGKRLDDDFIEAAEELLYGADLGPKIVQEALEMLESRKESQEEMKEGELGSLFHEFFKAKMVPYHVDTDPRLFGVKGTEQKRPIVIMIVGVNGAGKTTTIGKLATKLVREGNKVVVGACDTFRAAAVDQLQVWCDRAGATMIRAKEGAKPSGVGHEALAVATESQADYCLLDTAGRLHTSDDLMDELAKSKRVLTKIDASAPDHVLLVIDAITGQNALRQAEEFHKCLGLTGLIFTKCDGSSKAGSAVGIVESLKVPITYIGVGEDVEDLNSFNVDEYLQAMLAQD